MPKRTLLNPLVLTVALVIGAGPYVVRAAGNQGGRAQGPVPVAMVDMQKVYEESEARVQAEAKARAFNLKASQNFEETTRLQFVTAEELEEFSRVINAEKPVEADTKKIAAVRTTSAERGTEYQALLSKPQANLTPQDKTRMRQLSQMAQERQVFLSRLEKFYQEAVDNETAKQRRNGLAEVRTAVQKLAKEQSFTYVYDVTALVYAPDDLTEQALKRVRAKK